MGRGRPAGRWGPRPGLRVAVACWGKAQWLVLFPHPQNPKGADQHPVGGRGRGWGGLPAAPRPPSRAGGTSADARCGLAGPASCQLHGYQGLPSCPALGAPGQCWLSYF